MHTFGEITASHLALLRFVKDRVRAVSSLSLVFIHTGVFYIHTLHTRGRGGQYCRGPSFIKRSFSERVLRWRASVVLVCEGFITGRLEGETAVLILLLFPWLVKMC